MFGVGGKLYRCVNYCTFFLRVGVGYLEFRLSSTVN